MEPLQWLGLAWRDMERAPWPGLLHGLVAALAAVAAFVFAHQRFWLLAGSFSGFLLVAPLVATGLYAISKRKEKIAESEKQAAVAAAIAKASADAEAKLAEELAKAEVAGKRRIEVEVKKALEAAAKAGEEGEDA